MNWNAVDIIRLSITKNSKEGSMSLLHIRLVEAVGLPSADFNGFADPYCKVYLENVTHLSENKVFKSAAKKKCTDPIFDCAASLNLSPKDLSTGYLNIDIYDRDVAKKNDDELGFASLPLSYFNEKSQFQGWLPVRSMRQISKNKKRQLKSTKTSKSQSPNTEKEQSPQLQYLNESKLPPTTHQKDLESIDILPNDASIRADVSLRVGTPTEKVEKLANVTAEFMKTREANLEIAKTESFANNGVIAQSTKPSVNKQSSHSDYSVTSSLQASSKENQTLYDIPTETQLEDKLMKSVSGGHQHGKRNRDSGRIFIVVHYQKQFTFGKMSNDQVKKSRKSNRNLKIENVFSVNIPINVFCLSFNAGNCSLSEFGNSLSEWLPNDGSVDLYALAFQELNQRGKDEEEEEKDEDKEDMNQQDEIEQYFLTHLGDEYVTIAHYKMWQTRLFLFTKRKYSDSISNVTSHHEATGIANIVKNKGGVAISLDFDGMSMCFISCHLAAHQTKIKERNAMYKKLCKNIKVGTSLSISHSLNLSKKLVSFCSLRFTKAAIAGSISFFVFHG